MAEARGLLAEKEMKASFVFGETKVTLKGEVVKQNALTAWIKTTLPEDFGGKEVILKRNIKKHQVVTVAE